MNEEHENQPAKRPVGRPEKQDIKLPASAEEIARNIFDNAKPVDPSKRQTNQNKGSK